MHLGRENNLDDHKLAGIALQVTKEEKDLGVLIRDNLKPAAQCAKAARKAQAVLGQITRAFQYRDKRVFIQLYKQYVRPHLEFAAQAWAPWNQADKDLLEKVPKRAAGMVFGLRSREYEDRLRELEMTTLEERRHKADMLQMFKIMQGDGQQNPADWFRPPAAAEAAARTRQHADPLNVRPNYGRLEIRRHSFAVRAGEPWNEVPGCIKRAHSHSIQESIRITQEGDDLKNTDLKIIPWQLVNPAPVHLTRMAIFTGGSHSGPRVTVENKWTSMKQVSIQNLLSKNCCLQCELTLLKSLLKNIML
jgi:hypothetical protein